MATRWKGKDKRCWDRVRWSLSSTGNIAKGKPTTDLGPKVWDKSNSNDNMKLVREVDFLACKFDEFSWRKWQKKSISISKQWCIYAESRYVRGAVVGARKGPCIHFGITFKHNQCIDGVWKFTIHLGFIIVYFFCWNELVPICFREWKPLVSVPES